jgi:hypothetical protein
MCSLYEITDDNKLEGRNYLRDKVKDGRTVLEWAVAAAITTLDK